MRTSAIIRIVIWSTVIVFLASLLGAGLIFNRYRDQLRETTPEATMVPVAVPLDGEEDPVWYFDSDYIRNLKVEWAAGTIIIVPSDKAETIQVWEEQLKSEKHRMVCTQNGEKLTIRFSRDSLSGFGISIAEELQKNLIILVPIGWQCDSLEIDAASADVSISNLTIREVDFDGASGICHFENCIVDSMDLDTASGDIHFSGSLKELDFDAASASFYGQFLTTPKRIDMDSMSGNLELTLPEDTGFAVRIDGLSSQFSSDFPTVTQNGSHIYGDGSCTITVDAMSGDVTIHKK